MPLDLTRTVTDSDVVLRPLQPADEPIYVGLFTSVEVMAAIGPPRDVDDARAAFARACAYNAGSDPGHRFWIASAEGTDLGLVALVRDGATAELGIMFRPDASTGRHARPALAAAVEYAFREQGIVRITAESAGGSGARLSERLLRPYPFRRQPAPPGRARWTLDRAEWRDGPAARTGAPCDVA